MTPAPLDALAHLATLRADLPPDPFTEMADEAAPARTEGDDAAAGTIPGLLSPSEVAAHFNRSTRTLRRWVAQGHLRPVRVGGAVFFRAGDVRALIGGFLTAQILTASRGFIPPEDTSVQPDPLNGLRALS